MAPWALALASPPPLASAQLLVRYFIAIITSILPTLKLMVLKPMSTKRIKVF